jgi:hypothetical protein
MNWPQFLEETSLKIINDFFVDSFFFPKIKKYIKTRNRPSLMLMLKFCFFILFILVDKSVNCFTSKPFSLKRTIYFLPKGQYLNSECFNTRNSLRTKTDLKGTKLSKICINIYSKVSPSIVGGFLSGGLHAITGKCIIILVSI